MVRDFMELQALREEGYYLYRFHTLEVIGDTPWGHTVAYLVDRYEVNGIGMTSLEGREPCEVGKVITTERRVMLYGEQGAYEVWALAKSWMAAVRDIEPLVKKLLDLPEDWVADMVQADKKARERFRLQMELGSLFDEIEAALQETGRLEPEWLDVAEVIRTAMAVALQDGSIGELKDACRKLAAQLRKK